jgi:hypothetical protein
MREAKRCERFPGEGIGNAPHFVRFQAVRGRIANPSYSQYNYGVDARPMSG